jgi:hypothetical protein
MPSFVPGAKIPDTNEKSGKRQIPDSLVVSIASFSQPIEKNEECVSLETLLLKQLEKLQNSNYSCP